MIPDDTRHLGRCDVHNVIFTPGADCPRCETEHMNADWYTAYVLADQHRNDLLAKHAALMADVRWLLDNCMPMHGAGCPSHDACVCGVTEHHDAILDRAASEEGTK